MLAAYDAALAAGRLQPDPAQASAAQALSALEQALAAPVRHSWFKPAAASPKSLYVWGEVGRGKSMLMDMFFASLPVAQKRRVHFHAFMQEIHAALHRFRQAGLPDPLAHAAREMAAGAGRVLCLDELQVTDVADAMILRGLFTLLLEHGIAFVITANRPPRELYQGGLQREQFLAFIALLEQKADILHLAAALDYRLQQLRALKKIYLTPLTRENETRFQGALETLTHHQAPVPMTLLVQGRFVPVARAYDGVAAFTFAELCEAPLGAADYLAIAARFRTVCLERIPELGPTKRNEARRFVTLIDALYDAHVTLLCTAAVPPEALYPAGDGAFEFQRTVSRLAEMQSEGYIHRNS